MALVFRREGQRPRLSTRWPAAALWGGSRRAEPPGAAPVSDRGDDAFSAGNETDPKPFAPQGQGRFRLDISTTPRAAVVLGA